MSFDEIRTRVEEWRDAGRRYGEAVLTGAWRSAPRRPGARFVRATSGEIAGNISAGCVEADLAERLDRILAGDPPARVTYEVSDETATGVGLACGGRIDVHLSARAPDEPTWPVLLCRLDERSPAILLTDLAPGSDAKRWLVDPSGEVLAADAKGPPPGGAVEAGRRMLRTGGLAVVDRQGEVLASSEARAAGDPAILVETVLPARRLVIVGATPVGATLARLAWAAEIPVFVIEPRDAYADLLGDAGIRVDRRWPDEALEDLDLDPSTALAVVAHDERLDVSALQIALARSPGYVGLLGGGRTRRRRFEALEAGGLSRARIERIRAPIGLDIGAERPAEIAVAILAEIVASWRTDA